MSSVAVLIAAVSSVALGAQSGGTMTKGDKMDKMEMMGANYTGCIEAGRTAGTFVLTHVATADHMGKDMMRKDARAEDTMAKDTTARGGMSHESMAPATLSLTGPSVDLSKHLGHKVSITGSLEHEKMDATEKGAMGKSTSTFTVKSLKMVAATCS
jgi:pentapeptide MXKDX repeat protein